MRSWTIGTLTGLLCTPLLTLTGTAVAAPPEDPTAPGTTRTLSMTAPGKVWEDRRLVLRGQLLRTTVTAVEDPDPTDTEVPAPTVTTTEVAAARIHLWSRRPGASWRRVGAPVQTGPHGRWRASRAFAVPGEVELQARSGSASSPVQRVTIGNRRVVLTSLPQRARVLVDRPVVRGRVVPAEPGVVVQVRHRQPTLAWQTKRVRTDADGRWKATLPVLRRTGRLQVRARTGTGERREGTSPRSSEVRAEFVARDSSVTASTVKWSYRRGCPVGPSQLTKVRMTYQSYDGSYRWGTLIVARTGRNQIVGALERGFETGFRIHHMSPVERYRGSDPAAMADNNTSAFNCRRVTGDPYSLSPHSYGTAVDINTVQNPYQDSYGRWWPSRNQWVDRGRSHPGLIKAATPLRVSLGNSGWQWGGFWSHPDWQHFDPGGRFRPRTDGEAELTRWLPHSIDGLPAATTASDHATGTELAPVAPRSGPSAATVRERDPAQVIDALRYTCGSARGEVRAVAASQRGYRAGTRWAQALVIDFSSAADAGRAASWLSGCGSDRMSGWAQQVTRVAPSVLRLTARSS